MRGPGLENHRKTTKALEMCGFFARKITRALEKCGNLDQNPHFSKALSSFFDDFEAWDLSFTFFAIFFTCFFLALYIFPELSLLCEACSERCENSGKM